MCLFHHKWRAHRLQSKKPSRSGNKTFNSPLEKKKTQTNKTTCQGFAGLSLFACLQGGGGAGMGVFWRFIGGGGEREVGG